MSGDIKGLATSKRLSKDNLADRNINEKKNFVTVQPIGSERHALDTIPIGYYFVQEDETVEAGSSDTVVVLTAHGAKRGDIVRIQTTANPIDEFEVAIDRIIDANSFELAGILSASLTTGDEISILRPVAQRLSQDGATLATVQSGPVTFNLDGAITQVNEDTLDANNNIPLPVKLMGLTGPVTLEADQINVQISHTGTNFDSVRIGDGTNLLEVNANNEALTYDASAEALLSAIEADIALIEGKDFATETTLAAQAADIALIEGKDFATETTLAAQALNIASIAGEDFATETTLAALETKAATETTLSAVNTKLPGSLGEKAEASSFAVTLSTENEAILSAIDGKLPATLGEKAEADSLSVTLSTENESTLIAVSDSIGAVNNVSETDHTQNATVISLLKGLVELSANLSELADIGALANAQYSDHQTQTVASTAGGVDFTAPAGARQMQIQNSTQAGSGIRFTPIADTPTATDGFYLEIGQSTPIMPAGSFTAIAVEGGQTGNVTVNWFV